MQETLSRFAPAVARKLQSTLLVESLESVCKPMEKNYESLDDLPQSLKEELPDLAQRTYLSTYRRVWEKCHMGGMDNESDLSHTAHEAAMLAVQAQFEKAEDGQWREAPVAAEIDSDKLEGKAPDSE